MSDDQLIEELEFKLQRKLTPEERKLITLAGKMLQPLHVLAPVPQQKKGRMTTGHLTAYR